MIFSAEWTYLLATRKVGGEDSVFSNIRIKYGPNATDTVTGTIIYPDDFSFSEAGVASIAFGARPIIQINAADWATLEEAGCIFLPGASYRGFSSGAPIMFDANFGFLVNYWSATATNASQAKSVFIQYLINPKCNPSDDGRFNGLPVRLAQDLK